MLILDGEHVYYGPSTNKPIAICNTGYRKKLKQVLKIVDIQALNNNFVMHLPLVERRKLLLSSLMITDTVQIVEWQPVDSIDCLFEDFQESIQQGLEGFILKYDTSLYFSNQRRDWIKMNQLYIENRLEICLLQVPIKIVMANGLY